MSVEKYDDRSIGLRGPDRKWKDRISKYFDFDEQKIEKQTEESNKNISNFKTKLDIAREKNETDKEAIAMYYEGIVDSLKN